MFLCMVKYRFHVDVSRKKKWSQLHPKIFLHPRGFQPAVFEPCETCKMSQENPQRNHNVESPATSIWNPHDISMLQPVVHPRWVTVK